MGLSTQERTYSLCYPKSFMDISRAFCFGGTMQVRVPSAENQTARVLGLLEAPHLGAGVLAGCPAELVKASLTGAWPPMTLLPWCSSPRAATLTLREQKGLAPPSGISPRLAVASIPEALGADARL